MNVRSQRLRVGIVGAGIIGLTTALKLSEAGYQVTIVARELPGDESTKWASPWAGAAILPYATNDVQDVKMQIASFRWYWSLAHQDPTSGVQTVKVTEYWDEASHDQSLEWYASKWPDFRRLDQSELPAGVLSGNQFMSLTVNPAMYLRWLQDHLQEVYGVTFTKGHVSSLQEASKLLGCRVLVNASGLGAETLALDEDVMGVRGQTMLVEYPVDPASPTGWMDREALIRRGSEYTYVIPRMHTGVIIGGISGQGGSSTEISVDIKMDILRRVNLMTQGKFRHVDVHNVRKDIVGIRPDRKGGYRLSRSGNTVHAYGFGGGGYRYSVGAAEVATALVKEAIQSSGKL